MHPDSYDGRELRSITIWRHYFAHGTTTEGGSYNPDAGTVFELTPEPGGWTEKVVHSFGSGKDGFDPFGGLITDAAGNLYGTTVTDGGLGYGTVFELSPRLGGGWTEKVLHRFTGYDGASPGTALIFDAAGDLYGTTFQGGSGAGCYYGCGTVFELALKVERGWTEKILRAFSLNGKDGFDPEAGLVLDAFGDLYGTTLWGGRRSMQELRYLWDCI